MNTKLLIGALALGSVLALSMGTAMAAPPSIQFGIQFGNQPPPPPPPPPQHLMPPPPPDDDCLPIKEIFSDLGDDGYYNFRHYMDAADDYFTVDARYGQTRRYHLTVDSCTGDLLSRKRINSGPF